MKKISRRSELPASPADVFAVISDESFQDEKALLGTLPGSDSVVTTDAERVRIVTTRILSSDILPSAARSLVGDQLTIEETHDWEAPAADGSRRGSFVMVVKGTPVTMTGTLGLLPGGTGTIYAFDGELVAKIPFLGGKIEDGAAPALEEAITGEIELLRSRL